MTPTAPSLSLDHLLVVTPHSSGAVPADVLRQMLGQDFFDTQAREARLRHLFLDGDPYTDLMYAVPGAAFLGAAYSRFVVDLNRLRDDTEDNGVIKRMDFDRQPLYPEGLVLSAQQYEARLKAIWDSFDAQLQQQIQGKTLLIVGHSMAPHGPKLGPDTGTPRPAICLMLGEEAAPSYPRQHWEALRLACEQAFGPVLPAHLNQVSIGTPWASDTISTSAHERFGVAAFGIELNSALFMEPPNTGGAAKSGMLQALALAFEDFAGRALALITES